MLSFLLINTALSASTDGGIQLALYEAGVDFAQGFVEVAVALDEGLQGCSEGFDAGFKPLEQQRTH